jgi:hypothetical protein
VYVVFSDELAELVDVPRNSYRTIEQAFAQICLRAGCSYHFEQEQDGWRLVLTDGERPECSPDPLFSTYIKAADAKRDLMQQAVALGVKGHIALALREFETLVGATAQAAE